MARRRHHLQVATARDGELVVEADPDRPSGRRLLDRGMESSFVDLADPRHLEFAYLRWMRAVLRTAGAHRVLHLGGGACALARALAAEDRTGHQEVCEIDADVMALAREHLGLRRLPGLRVRTVDGRAHLEAQGDGSWDAVVIDAFIGARLVPQLISADALGEAARVAPMVLINVVDSRAGREVAGVAVAMTEAFPRVWGLGDRSGHGNTVLVGDGRATDLARVASTCAADRQPARLLQRGRLGI